MKNNFKRCLAMLLAVMMVVGACAFPISAAGNDEPLVLDPNCVHEWGEGPKETVKPDCEKQGYELWYCSKCLGYETRNVQKALGHDEKTIVGSEATCDAPAVEGGIWCNRCEKWLKKDVDAHDKLACGDACNDGHILDDACKAVHKWVLTTDGILPCTDPNAKLEYVCTICEATAATNKTVGEHSYTFLWNADTFKAPTCTEDGSVQRVCTVCGDEQDCREPVTVVIKALGHVLEVNAEASKDNDKCVKTCTRCKKDVEFEHEVSNWNVDTDSTCKVEGTKSGVCTVCNNDVTAVVEKKTHEWVNGVVTTEPTCTTEGVKTFECTYCDDTKTEAVTKVPHVLDGGTKTSEYAHANKQYSNEEYTYYCTGAGCDYFEVKVTKEAKHEESTPIVKDSTCTEWGFSYKQCSVCGYSYDYKDIPLKEHVVDKTATPDMSNFNCKDGGYYIYPCVNFATCGATINVDVKVTDEDHDFQTQTQAATHLVDGWSKSVCTKCGAQNGDTQILYAEGHKWYGGVKDGEWSWTFGANCEEDRYYYKWCTVADCDFYCPVDPANYATDAEINAALDIAFKSNRDLFRSEEHYKFIPASGHVNPNENGEFVELKKADCKSHAIYGYVCSCGTTIIDHYGEKSDQNNHVGNMILRHFVWACNNTSAEYFYSIYDCDACSDVNEIHVRTTIDAAKGIKLTTNETLAESDSSYTLVESISVYVNGTLQTQYAEEFVIAPNALKENAVGGENKHAWDVISEETCDVTGKQKCLICGLEEVIPVNDNHKWNYVFDCVNGGTKTCTVCDTVVTLDPIEGGHTDPADADKIIADPDACESEWTGECANEYCTATVTGTIEKADGLHSSYMKFGNVSGTVNQTTYRWLAAMPTTLPDDFRFTDIPDCLNSVGKAETTCDRCDVKFEFTIEIPVDHVYENRVVAENIVSSATCNAYAVYYKSCACGLKSSETFEDVNGGYVDCNPVEEITDAHRKTAATCLEKAVYYYSCEWCDANLDDTFEYGDYAKCKIVRNTALEPVNPVLCQDYSFKVTEYCDHCDTVYTIEEFEGKYGHVNGTLVTEPATCMSPAYSYYKCKYCNDKIESTVVRGADNGPHRNSVGEPLTGNCGFTVTNNDYTCTTCGKQVLPDNHVWGTPVTDKHITTTTCTVPGCGVTTTNSTAHERDEGTIKTPATATTYGEMEFFCTICGESMGTEPIEPIKTITLSLDKNGLNNQNVFVNGGKVYVTIYIDLDNTVTTTFVACNIALQINSDHLKFVKVVDNSSMFGVNTDAQQVGNTVAVYGMIGINDNPVAIPESKVFCVLEFDIIYTAGVYADRACEQDVKATDISFGEVEIINENDAIMGVKAANSTTIEIDQVGDFDNDGRITASDAAKLLREIEETYVTDGYYNAIADINRDGKLDIEDLTLMRKYLSMKIATYEEFAGFERSQYI